MDNHPYLLPNRHPKKGPWIGVKRWEFLLIEKNLRPGQRILLHGQLLGDAVCFNGIISAIHLFVDGIGIEFHGTGAEFTPTARDHYAWYSARRKDISGIIF